MFFTFCFKAYCFPVGMRSFIDYARRTSGLECYGLLNIRVLAVVYSVDMNLDMCLGHVAQRIVSLC